MLALMLIFARLGVWQLDRAAIKDHRLSEFSSAPEFTQLPDPGNMREFTRLELEGRFKQQYDTLADNQVLAGRPGVHVYTAFELDSGEKILVNRGWLPMPENRLSLPLVDTPAGQLEISGRIGPMPLPGRQLGKEGDMLSDQWPQLVTYPKLDKISVALSTKLYPWVLFLDETSAGGFSGRQWKPVFMSPSRHRAYAFQWFALAFTAFLGWIFLTVRRGEQK